MKIFAIGDREMLIGFWLSGIKQSLETEDPSEALRFIHGIEQREKACLIVMQSKIYHEIEENMKEIQERKASFIFYEFSGGGLKWRKKK